MSDRLPFEITTPGTRLALSNQDFAWRVQKQLSQIEDAFREAAMAVFLFEQSSRNLRSSMAVARQRQETHSMRVGEVLRAREKEIGERVLGWGPAFEAVRIQAERQVMLEDLEQGVVPEQLFRTTPFIYAKAFLYAADEIGKIMGRLAAQPDLPEAARDACRAYYSSFPSLREVRNSVQHIEDRGRGLGRGEKPLDLKPVANRMVNAPEGVLIMHGLNGTKYGATMADGHYGEVEVSQSSLACIRDHIELVFGAMPWSGPEQHFPMTS